MTALVAGLDYSSRAINLALVRGRSLVYHAEHRLGADLSVSIGVMAGAIEDQPCAIYYEKPWMQMGKGMKTAMKLHLVPVRFETLAVAATFKLHEVPINTWRAQVLGNGGLKTDAAKAAAMQYVRRVYEIEPDNDNVADSICIATFGAQLLAQRERVTA
jgi:hypothetical protein